MKNVDEKAAVPASLALASISGIAKLGEFIANSDNLAVKFRNSWPDISIWCRRRFKLAFPLGLAEPKDVIVDLHAIFAIIANTDTLRPILEDITVFRFALEIWKSENIPAESEGLVSEILDNSDLNEFNGQAKFELLFETLEEAKFVDVLLSRAKSALNRYPSDIMALGHHISLLSGLCDVEGILDSEI